MNQLVYLDNSATTKPCETAIKYINNSLLNNWGNPSSLHSLGLDAELEVTKARETIAKSISARADEIIFTGSGTEANNTAIMSVLNSRNKKIITTKIEHPSVLDSCKQLEELFGFEVTYLDVDKYGKINLEQLKNSLRKDTILVSIMAVNNEMGSIQDIKSISKIIKEKASTERTVCQEHHQRNGGWCKP